MFDRNLHFQLNIISAIRDKKVKSEGVTSLGEKNMNSLSKQKTKNVTTHKDIVGL